MNVVNGSLPASLLVEVEPGLSLEPATAEAYKRMKAAAAQDGVTLAIPRPAGAYRSLFVQKDMRERGWLYNLDPTSSVALAAPGYSTHGLGDRVDIVRGAAGDWAIRNAHRFGFVREFGAADPRHFRFTKPTWAASAVIPIPKPTPAPTAHTDEEDDHMSIKVGARKEADGTAKEWMRAAPFIAGGYEVTTDESRARAWGRLHGRGHGPDGWDFFVPREDYIAIQKEALSAHRHWLTNK